MPTPKLQKHRTDVPTARHVIRLLFANDFHCGHEVGLWPDGQMVDHRGAPYPIGDTQRILLAHWKSFLTEVREDIKPDILLLNGDFLDGEQRHSLGREGVNLLPAQQKAAVKLLEPLVAQVKETYAIRGCVTPGHRVLLADLRWVPVETLLVGDKLLAFDDEGPNRRWKTATVLAAHPDVSDVVEITLEDGRRIACTEDHPFLVYQGTHNVWTIASSLKVGRSRLVELLPVWAMEDSRAAGWLAGVMESEGSLSFTHIPQKNGPSTRLMFAQKGGVVQDRFLALSQERGFRWSNQQSTSRLRGADHFTLLGGRREIMRFLGSLRPQRLLDKFDGNKLGGIQNRGSVSHKVVARKALGRKTIISLTTTSSTYIVEGVGNHNTPYHDGARAMDIESVATSLGAIGPNPDWHTWDLLDLEIRGVIINLQHAISIASGFYRATPLDREGIFSALAGKESMSPKADAVVRAHAHVFVHVEHPTKHIFIVPCWQGQTEYMRRHSAYRMFPQIGAVVLDIDPREKARGRDPVVRLQKLLYPLPAREPWKSNV